MLKSGLSVGIFNISTFSMALCLFSLHLMEIIPMAHKFWKKNIVKHSVTVVKWFETTITTKCTTVNHYLSNCSTKN